MIDFLILMTAAFGAGVLNTIAGGGTFLTLPALVFTGVPPVAANATSAIAVFPGYLGGALGFIRELKDFSRWRLARLAAITLLGSLAGSGLLLISSNKTFSVIVPFLLLAATLAFLFGDRIRAWAASKSGIVQPEGAVGLFLVSIYGGYFNGGLGIVLLALFSLWGMADIHRMNGLKNALSFSLSAVSVIVFSAAGIVVLFAVCRISDRFFGGWNSGMAAGYHDDDCLIHWRLCWRAHRPRHSKAVIGGYCGRNRFWNEPDIYSPDSWVAR